MNANCLKNLSYAEKYLRFVTRYLDYLNSRGGFADVRVRPAVSGNLPKTLEPFDTATEVAPPMIFSLVHAIELLLKAWQYETVGTATPNHSIQYLFDQHQNSNDANWSPLKPPLKEVHDALKQLDGPFSGNAGAAQTKKWSSGNFDSWYATSRYPELTPNQAKKVNGGSSTSDSATFILIREDAWENLYEAVTHLWKAFHKLPIK